MGIVSWLTLHFFDTSVFDSSKTIYLVVISGISCLSGLVSFVIFAKLLSLEELNDYSRQLSKFKNYLLSRL
jgi:hypothetical protein